MRSLLTSTLLAWLIHCGGPAPRGQTATPPASDDAGSFDAGAADAGAVEVADAGADAGLPDGGAVAGSDAGQPEADAGGADAGPADAGADGGASPGWYTLHEEKFEQLALPAATWQPDPVPDDGPFADNGVYFRNRGVRPPAAWRTSVPFGESNWLTADSYTRAADAPFADRLQVVADPADPTNHALRLASPAHTDATTIRPTNPLPARYRVSLRVGFADFGDGAPGGLNGYKTGGEMAEPWLPISATGQNGFYWLSILDAQPRPHNNVWIHHHRKLVMDSDNNVPPWMEMWNGTGFAPNGEHPIMMIALDGNADPADLTGSPFYSYSAGEWQPSGKIRAVDSYLPGEWYTAMIERDGDTYTLQISGHFKYGGVKTYRAAIDAAKKCVWHYNNQPDSPCSNSRASAAVPDEPFWPKTGSWADWFVLGDPHENFYQGQVLYDDIKLEAWR